MSDWDAKDTTLLTAALGATYADVQSTKDLFKRGGEETNPLLGRSPSGEQLDAAGLLAALLGAGTALALPGGVRKPALGAWAGLEIGLANYNRQYDAKKGGGKFDAALKSALPLAALGGLLGHLMDDDKGLSVDIGSDSHKGKSALSGTLTYKRGF